MNDKIKLYELKIEEINRLETEKDNILNSFKYKVSVGENRKIMYTKNILSLFSIYQVKEANVNFLYIYERDEYEDSRLYYGDDIYEIFLFCTKNYIYINYVNDVYLVHSGQLNTDSSYNTEYDYVEDYLGFNIQMQLSEKVNNNTLDAETYLKLVDLLISGNIELVDCLLNSI